MLIKKSFSPITLTIETEEELSFICDVFRSYMDKEVSGFRAFQRDPSERYRKAEYIWKNLSYK